MKLRITRTHNDNLINNGVKTEETFEVSPHDLNHEMIGWELQFTDYDEANDTMTFVLWDKSEPEDYLENK